MQQCKHGKLPKYKIVIVFHYLEYGETLSETKLIWYDAIVLAKDGGMATQKMVLHQILKMWCRLDESKIKCGFINWAL